MDIDFRRIKNILLKMASDLGMGEITAVEPIAEAGSDRRHFRLSNASFSCIATFDPNPEEARCFISLSNAFIRSACRVPRILKVSDDPRFYLQEDLGSVTLFSLLSSPELPQLVENTLKALVQIQKVPSERWKTSCLAKDFGRRQVMWDLNYFKYELLKPRKVLFDEEALEDDFEKLSIRLVTISEEFKGFQMRDCQSRNVMIAQDGPVFIDFQGGRYGPLLYDAVSFLWQARARFSKDFRMRALTAYCREYCDGDTLKMEEMLSSLDDMVLFRTLQVLGAYGFRGLVQHRAHFLLSFPGAIANLSELLDSGALHDYPELSRVATQLVSDPQLSCPSHSSSGLLVEIYSFSYKKGYPQDLSGNGGGFMFDCRAMHNPGRYDRYKALTGRDSEVADFLEKRGEVMDFLSAAWALTDPAVERYIDRGFSKLQIGFGCTGGQHRSVYCAEKTARHIRDIFPEVEVSLIHREHPADLL